MGEDVRDLRRRLHRAAERSGEEKRTAEILRSELEPLGPDELVDGLGGHGIAAVFGGAQDGPTVLVRGDMDALPLPDDPSLEHASETPGTAHLCGHDGHMTIVVGVARRIAARRPERGRVVVLFQPAEETGAGAHAVIEDPAFAPLRPDFAIAQHNLPGQPLGAVVLRHEVFASASRGMIIDLHGRSAHAAEPQEGRTPVPAAAALSHALAALPQNATALHETGQVTVVGVEVGGPAFGTSPGDGRVMATLRAHEQGVIDRLAERATDVARGIAATFGLEASISWAEEFPSSPCDDELVDVVDRTARARGMQVVWRDHPYAWSEDFGHFTSRFRGVLFGLGSGVDQPALHGNGYDFPDALLEPGSDLLTDTVHAILDPGRSEREG